MHQLPGPLRSAWLVLLDFHQQSASCPPPSALTSIFRYTQMVPTVTYRVIFISSNQGGRQCPWHNYFSFSFKITFTRLTFPICLNPPLSNLQFFHPTKPQSGSQMQQRPMPDWVMGIFYKSSSVVLYISLSTSITSTLDQNFSVPFPWLFSVVHYQAPDPPKLKQSSSTAN